MVSRFIYSFTKLTQWSSGLEWWTRILIKAFIIFVLSLEIPDFLSGEECDHIINLAIQSGLHNSVAGFDHEVYKGDLQQELSELGTFL